MRINKVSLIPNNISFSSNKVQKKKKDSNNYLLIGATTLGVASVGLLAYSYYKNNYITQLANDLSRELGQKITSKHLKSVMTKEELLKELSKMNEQNFIASAENIKNGTFLADLHSHSHYSDGTIKIKDFLNQAVEYGNKLNKINGKKFIITLSDHDGIKGVEEALKLIVQDPEKYKNIRFVPAAEMSFIMPCKEGSRRFQLFKSEVETPEVLIYNINPFSKESKNFFNNLYSKRMQGIKDAINEAKKLFPDGNFSFEEYTKFYNPQEKYCFSNQHWKVWNYLHTKSRFAEIAKERNCNADSLYAEHFHKIKKYDKNVYPYSLKKYIEGENIQTKSQEINPLFGNEFKKQFFPQKKNDFEAFSPYEYNFDDIIKYAKKENAIMGFAHPAFTMQNFLEEDIYNRMLNLIKKSDGRLKLVEKYHQAYHFDYRLSQDELARYNKIVDKLNLIQMGGRDNHTPKLF